MKMMRALVPLRPCDWRKFCDRRQGRDTELLVAADETAARGVRLLLQAEYVGLRMGSECGDHKNHETAAKAVSRLHRKLRKALGFSYPDSGLIRL